MAPNPRLDGVTHTNVYSRGRTDLGRFLTNFAHVHIQTTDGPFESVEGYWHWLGIPSTTPGHDRLRHVWGYTAKKLGKELRKDKKVLYIPDFEQRIRLAVRDKLEHAPTGLLSSPAAKLPLAHYYVCKSGRVVEVSGKFKWLMDVWQEELDRATIAVHA